MNQKIDISRAIVIFLGYGISSFPKTNKKDLYSHFSSEDVAVIESDLDSIFKALGSIEIDWSNQTLESAGVIAKRKMAQAFPFLTNEALEALMWKFTYDWR